MKRRARLFRWALGIQEAAAYMRRSLSVSLYVCVCLCVLVYGAVSSVWVWV